jgi:hypothetical protein
MLKLDRGGGLAQGRAEYTVCSQHKQCLNSAEPCLGSMAEDVKRDRKRKEVASRLSREMSDRRDE